MMKNTLNAFLAALVCFCLFGCDLDDAENFNFVRLRILDAELPEFFEQDETYTVKVTYERFNDCVFFEGFDFDRTGLTTRRIVAIGTELHSETCSEAIEEVEATFTFNVRYGEDYIFHFFKGFDEEGAPVFLEFTVPVEEATSNQID